MATKRKKDSDWLSWVLIVILFAVGLFPVALILLLVKLFASDGRGKQTLPPPLQTSVQGKAPQTAAAKRKKQQRR